MDKMMSNPWFLRITALLLALLLFFSVKANDDAANPVETTTMTEEIEDVELEVYYDNTSLMVSGLPKTVDLTITGPTSIVQTARQIKDFTLFVDLRDLPIGQHQVPVQAENLSEQLRVRVDPSVVDVTIEERVTQEFRIEPEMNERLLKEGFVLESMEAKPNVVTVTGSKSVIDAISFVKATVTGEQNIDESFTAEANVRVLANDLTKLENVTIEPGVVDVNVEVEEYSKEVPVTIKQNGKPRTGIAIDSLTSSNETVRIYGPQTAVDQIKEYPIEINVGVITATDRDVEIDLKAPSGTTAVKPGKVTVEADITLDDAAELPDSDEDPEIADESTP
ncbi:CdaR family protein [Planococcus sp. N028]|uniref:CdaR family protein n=1 Tax=Planococcus shixiaomingii TaxID=3058393 RepID=A0ABT8N580_9BACL|nr:MULTISPECIES: CdaR family protein [unclassified Planococcus (in: firmicutes)]MDN7243036.1 CdaR family protein [Planococcus sp. N028]WKA54978.1 CdaR family protein [Planococcus sp. N022]